VRCKLLYNESIKSLSLIRNSSHVQCASEDGRGGWFRYPFTAQFSSFSSFYLSLSRLRGRLAFPICVTPESQITGPRTPFCFAHVSQQVKSLEARRAEERRTWKIRAIGRNWWSFSGTIRRQNPSPENSN